MGLTLDDLIPRPDFSSHHELRIAAPPAAVWEALQKIRLDGTALSRMLMGVRLLPGRLAGRDPQIASGRLLDRGPVPILASDPERSIVAGGVMQPWKLTGGEDPPALDADGLRAFAQPGWVKAAIDFVLQPDGAGTRVRTETRVSATDPGTRARFSLYWLIIRGGSGLIRRDLLRAIARHATTGEHGCRKGLLLRDRRSHSSR